MNPLRTTIFALTLVFSAGLSADEALKSKDDKLNYSIGYQIGGDLQLKDLKIDPEVLLKGIEDALSKTEPRVAPEEMQALLVELRSQMVAAQQAQQKAEAAQNLAKAEAFLVENGKKDGVETLPSGLQYKVLEPGKGSSPKATDRVTVNYRGSLIDGTEFDSSYKRNKPASFGVSGVIPGWTEALQLMKEGAKWQLFIPPKLAYGPRAAGTIPPNSTLIFEVELISVNGSGTAG